MQQQTLCRSYEFQGKGLHTGVVSKMRLCPAPEGTGILFIRKDIGPDAMVEALAENVSSTARSTTLGRGDVQVHTVEHLLSALTGLGVDNVIIEIDNVEVPILDGSARYYVEAIASDGLIAQEAPRNYVAVPSVVEVRDDKSGSWVRIEPSDTFGYDSTVDFNSRVLGVQTASWDSELDYASQIAPCRTFVFFHELEFLFANNLIKGGDVDNAIVIVEHPVSQEKLTSMAALFGKSCIEVREGGYLNNLELRFPNECGRHKLLDLIGDLRLGGGFLRAKVSAYKPGHGINTKAALALRQIIDNK